MHREQLEGPVRYVGAPMDKPAGFCRADEDKLVRVTAQWPVAVLELSSEVDAVLTKGHRAQERYPPNRQTCPIKLPLESLRHAIDVELSLWAFLLAEATGATLELNNTRLMPRIDRCATFLAKRTDDWLEYPAVSRPAWSLVGEQHTSRLLETTGLQGALRTFDLPDGVSQSFPQYSQPVQPCAQADQRNARYPL